MIKVWTSTQLTYLLIVAFTSGGYLIRSETLSRSMQVRANSD